MASLPTELFHHICSFLTPADLAVLSRVSSNWRDVSQSILYRHLSLSSLVKNVACVFSLAHMPHLACLVRSFTIRLKTYNADFCHTLALAVTNLSELTSLEVYADQAASWIMQNETTYPHLQSFACSFHLDPHLIHFLNKADSITTLAIDAIPISDVNLPLPSIALPCLSLRLPS